MAQRSGINRALMWLRRTLEITEETESPQVLSELLRPTIDVFGWERLSGRQTLVESNTSGVGSNGNVLSAVPDGIMRYVIHASCSHNDTVNPLTMSIQRRHIAEGVTTDLGVAPPQTIVQAPVRLGLDRPILLAPGEQLACFSTPAPGGAFALTLRMLFVDIDDGEYVPPR